ncbi:beta-galactosidase [Victivallis sp. Marseille-Q1083]|uniref:beta-galactosidase n=1 Tax=Victivallis sp. Marseille-Q1083 TaxID=2717288 RepID=UPI00158F4298|nr:beta-galactosidase [Victivallis sp. Marseille-Q1083]
MMKKKKFETLLVLAFGVAMAGSNQAAVAELEKDGKTLYELSNAYVSVRIDPSEGGRIVSFRQPGQNDLLTAVEREVSPGGSGGGLERVINTTVSMGLTEGQAETSPWRVVKVEEDDGASSLTLENNETSLHWVKTYRLDDRSASLRVEYAVDNPGEEPFFCQLWFVNAPYPAGTAAMRYYHSYALRSSWPDAYGGAPLTAPLAWPQLNGDFTVNAPVSDWCAALNDRNEGLLLETDYGKLQNFYHFMPKSAPVQSTLEHLTAPLKIKPLSEGRALAQNRGERADPLFDYIFRTYYTLTPLYDCPAVTAADNHIAAAFELADGKWRIRLQSDRDYERLVARSGETVREVSLKALAPAILEFPAEGAQETLTVVLSDPSGAPVATLEHNFDPAAPPAAKGEKDKIFAAVSGSAEFFTDYPADYIRWAADVARPLKVLLFATAWSHYDNGQLALRGNIDLELVEVGYPTWFGFDASDNRSWMAPPPEEYAGEVIRNDYDVIVISSAIRWYAVPDEVKEAIRQKVAAGTGFIYIDPPDGLAETGLPLEYDPAASQALNRAVPCRKLPAIIRESAPDGLPLSVYRSGKGTVVSINYCLNQNPLEWMIDSYGLIPGPEFGTDCRFNYYDYHFSQLLRALRWAGQDRPEPEITELTADGDRLTGTVQAGQATGATLFCQARDKYGRAVAEFGQPVALQAGSNSLELALPAEKLLLDGDYFFNLWLKVDGHTADWYTAVQNRPAHCAIADFTLTQKSFDSGQPVTGRFRLRGDLAGAQLSLRIQDRLGRLLYKQVLKDLSPEFEFRAALEALPETVLSTITAELSWDGKLVDRREESWTTPLPPTDDIVLIAWGTQSNYFADAYHARIAAMGFDEVIGYNAELNNLAEQRASAESCLRAGLNYLPIGLFKESGWSVEEIQTNPVREPCMNDPEHLKEVYDKTYRGVANLRDFHPNAYYVSDEASLGIGDWRTDYCFSPWCLDQFRRQLRERYDSVDRLNAVWGTEFKNWDEVRPFTYEESVERRNFNSWIAHRVFMFQPFTGVVKTQFEAMKAADPAGRLATSGMIMTNPYTGFDWKETLKYLARVTGYDQPESGMDDLWRCSQTQPHSQIGDWTGYMNPIREVREKFYREIMLGLRANGHWANGYLLRHGDMKLCSYGESLREVLQEIKASGVDAATLPANREPSRFAILFSLPSMLLSDAGDQKECESRLRRYRSNFGSWTSLLADLGQQAPTVLSQDELETLDPAVTPYLILPLAQALSEAQLRAVVGFVQAGGQLIADALPGTYDSDGVPRADNPLAELFGVRNAGSPVRGGVPAEFQGRTLRVELADPDLEAAGARAALAGEPEILFVHDGHVLINVLPDLYRTVRGQIAVAEPVMALFRQALAAARVPEPWDIRLPSGTESARYRHGGNRYLGFTRPVGENDRSGVANLGFDRKYYCYDLLQRQFVGQTDQLEFPLEKSAVRYFALLPAPTRPYQLTLKRDGRGWKATIANPGPDGIFRLEVSRPDGTVFKPATGNRLSESGSESEIVIDDGIEPRPGQWTVRLINLLDNTATEEKIVF